jgi:hypothetical protein
VDEPACSIWVDGAAQFLGPHVEGGGGALGLLLGVPGRGAKDWWVSVRPIAGRRYDGVRASERHPVGASQGDVRENASCVGIGA